MDHEEIVEITRGVGKEEREGDRGDQKIAVLPAERCTQLLTTAAGDEEQCKDVFAAEVTGVKDPLPRSDVEADEQAQQRKREAGPGSSPVLQSIALDGGPHEEGE